MAGVYEIKSGKTNPAIALQVAAQWELINRGTDDGLLFDSERHIFTLEETGKYLPSITQVLKAENLIPDYFRIDPWFMLRGSYIHRATELHDNNILDESTIDPEIAPYLEAYLKFRREWNGEIIEAEKRLWHPIYHYAGILDRVIKGSKCFILFLRKDGTYRFEPVKDLRGSLNVFLSALNVLRWKQENLKEDKYENLEMDSSAY